MSEITILHLSDIHFKKNKEEENKTFRQTVQQRLTEAVAAHNREHGSPDVVAVTGDIAFSGKKFKGTGKILCPFFSCFFSYSCIECFYDTDKRQK